MTEGGELAGPARKPPFWWAAAIAIAAGAIIAGVVILLLAGASDDDDVTLRAGGAVPGSGAEPVPLPPPEGEPHPPIYPPGPDELPPLPTTPTLLSHGGPAVPGALVSFSLAGLQAYAGQDISLTLQNRDGAEALYSAPVGGNGMALINVYLPHFLSHEGPCPTLATCDRSPVVAGALGVKVASWPEAGRQTLIDTEITVVPSTTGHLYPVQMLRECGPDRVELGGDVWVPAPGADVPAFTAPSVPGVFFYSPGTARYTPARNGTPIPMTRVHPATVERVC
jgi:hypothetical protein